jgi:hypothetical protein
MVRAVDIPTVARSVGDCSGIIREREQRYEFPNHEVVIGFDPSMAFNSLLLDIE